MYNFCKSFSLFKTNWTNNFKKNEITRSGAVSLFVFGVKLVSSFTYDKLICRCWNGNAGNIWLWLWSYSSNVRCNQNVLPTSTNNGYICSCSILWCYTNCSKGLFFLFSHFVVVVEHFLFRKKNLFFGFYKQNSKFKKTYKKKTIFLCCIFWLVLIPVCVLTRLQAIKPPNM